MKTPILNIGWMALTVALATGLFSQPALAQEENAGFDTDYSYGTTAHDPFEPLNRGIFRFNEAVDTVLLKPVAKGYKFVVPEFGRDRVRNALVNLGEPVNMLNGFLQGNPERGFTSMWRFFLNSTFGALGLFDFAGYNLELYHAEEDFGQSMGYYGWGTGPYLVLPILGPSNLRDALGRVVDIASDPFNYVDNADEFLYTRTALIAVDARSRNLDLIDDINETSFDPYATFRSIYTQRRNAMIRNNQPRQGSVGY